MTVYWHEGQHCWIYDFQATGKRYNRRAIGPDGTPATSRRQAEAIEAAARVEARNAARGLAIVRPDDCTLAQAVAARIEEARHFDNWRDIQIMLREIVAYFGAATPLRDVAERWRDYRAFARSRPVLKYRGGPRKPDAARTKIEPADTGRTRSAARTNRYLDQLSALLRLAHGSRGPGGRPLLEFMPKIEKLREPKRMPNPVPLPVLAALESDSATPDHLWQAAALSRLFGLRLDEAMQARADWIARDERALRLPAEVQKAERDEYLDGNAEAMQLLDWLALFARDRGDDYLIVYTPPGLDAKGKPHKPRPIRNPRRAWKSALRRLGVEGRWRFHDVRARYITEIANIASSATTQALARHKSAATTALYTGIVDAAKRRAAAGMRSTGNVTPFVRIETQTPDAKPRYGDEAAKGKTKKVIRFKRMPG